MSNSSEADKTGTVEVSGFDGLNIKDFIDAEMPANSWLARIRIGGITKNGHVAAKLHYIDIDGADSEAVNEYLERNAELPLTEIDGEIDIMKLLSEVEQLDVVLPNTVRLTRNHTMSVR